MGALALPVAASAQGASYSGTNLTGSASAPLLVRVVNLRQQAQARSFTSFSANTNDIVRPLPPRLTPAGAAFPSTPPKAAGGLASPKIAAAPLAVTSSKALTLMQTAGVTGFNALSHNDQRLAYNGNQFNNEPPNPSLAVGNGYLLEGVNDAIQIYDTSGAPALPLVIASNQVFGLGPAINRATGEFGVYFTDMRVYFDPGMNRWLIIQRTQDEDTAGNYLTSSHLYIAVSQSPDPTQNYNIYVMDTTNAAHFGCPCIADYPQIGADQFGFHIAWNEFNYDPGSGFYRYVDAAVLVMSKSSLLAGAAAPTAVQFILPYASGFEFSLQPATTPPGASNFIGSGGLEFFVSTVFGSGSEVALWAMYNTISLTTPNPAPTMIRTSVPTLSYFPAGSARQPSGATPYGSSLGEGLEALDGGDARVQAVSYASGRLYVTFGAGLFDESLQRAVGGVYLVISPTFRGGVLAGQTVSQGTLLVNGNDLLRPAIAVNAQGNGAIAVTLSGPTYFPSAALIPFQAAVAPSSVHIAGLGTLPEDGFSGYSVGGGFGVARWGDYNTAVADSDGSVWMVTQYIGSYPRSVAANWNTFIYRKPR